MALHAIDWHEVPPAACRGGAVTIGNFDGVHLGHAELVRHTCRLARPAVVLTFDPHPLQLLRPERFLPLLTTPADRAALLQQLGADEVVLLRTTPELLQLSAGEFFRQVLRDGLQLRALVEGEDFRFGHRRTGDVPLLRSLCQDAGIHLEVAPPVTLDGVPVSSSRVRTALDRGDVSEATRLLNRPHRLHGRVGTGQKRGRNLGFPTANLDPLLNFPPGEGVYGVRVPLGDRTWPGAANIGPNPTFGEHVRKVEVHLIGFAGDLYDQELAVDFLARLRDTRPFASVDELREQLKRDVDQARSIAAGG